VSDDGELEAEIPEGRGPDVIDQYELPPLFAKEGTDNSPTTRPIVWAYVYKKQGAQLGFLDFHAIEEMSDIDQLRDAYGGGVYSVQGRGANRKDTIKAVSITIGGRADVVHQAPAATRAELDFTKIAGAAMAVLTPVLTIWESISEKREQREERRREDERRARAEERERDDARQTAFMQSMTQLMGARMTDLEALLKAQQAAGGGAAGSKIHEAYSQGQAETLELIRMVKEEGLGGEDLESKVVGLVESFMIGKKKADEDVAAAANGKGPA
jgi:hypothetical protein